MEELVWCYVKLKISGVHFGRSEKKKDGAETLPQSAPQANKLLVVGWIVEEYVHGHREVTP